MYKYIWTLVLCLITSNLVFGSEISDPKYFESMEAARSVLEAAVTYPQAKDARERFARITKEYPDQWLALYYSAAADVHSVFLNEEGDDNDSVLQRAKLKLDRLSKMKDVDLSELNALMGYYYGSLILQDIAGNSLLYYKDLLSAINQANSLNPNNPRAILLRAVVNSFLPEMLKWKLDYCAELKRADENFKGEVKLTTRPYIGKDMVKLFRMPCS